MASRAEVGASTGPAVAGLDGLEPSAALVVPPMVECSWWVGARGGVGCVRVVEGCQQ